jgi:pimeloyl-ACP methyl ester carboxylesterase/DNA-binding CsgD family transcriptional regulator
MCEHAMADVKTIAHALTQIGLLRPDGSILDDEDGFLAAISPLDRVTLVELARTSPGVTSYEVVDCRGGTAVVVAVTSFEQARAWQVRGLAALVAGSKSAIAVCRLSPTGVQRRLQAFGEAFGLSPAVMRVLVALYEHCDVRDAATAAGVSFKTARGYLNEARATVWAPNLPRLITWAGVGSFASDASGESDHPVADLFSLSERQRQLAGLIADGLSRVEAARSLGISEAVAKKELAAVYAATGVTNATGLARIFAELRGLAIVTRSHSGPPEPYPPPPSRNLVLTDSDGRSIAVSDYGPRGGKPVLVLHNTMNCRGVDRSLVRALQASGYRPVSSDRPGYGETDPPPQHSHGQAYLDVCVRDIALICQELRWGRISVIAHGPVHVALALYRARPDLLDRVVIDAPEPDSAYGAATGGMMSELKRQFARRPWAVASVVSILSALASYERVSSLMRDWTATSPSDRAAMGDPALMMDFYRKLVPFRKGKIDGFVREQVLQATMGKPAPIPGTSGITLVVGQTDFMHDADENLSYWKEVLPDARLVKIADAGRFISYTHPERLVAELARRP